MITTTELSPMASAAIAKGLCSLARDCGKD